MVAALRKALKGQVNGDPWLNQTSAWPIYMYTGQDRGDRFVNLAWEFALFGISCLGWFLVGLWWKIFALLSCPTAFSWRRRHRRRGVGALLFQSAQCKIKSIASSKWIDCRPMYCCNRFKKPSCMPLTKVQQTLINWTSPKSKSWCEKMLQMQLNGVNQPNQCSEPLEPLDSPHESPISKRKICSRRRPSTRTFVWIFANMRHIFAPCLEFIRKLQFSFCKTSLGIMSTEEKERIFSRLPTAGCQLQRACLLYLQRMRVDKRSIRGRLDVENFFYPKDPRNTDWPTQESLRNNCPISRKAYMFKEEL